MVKKMDLNRALELIYGEVLQEDRDNFTQIFRDRVEQVVKWIMEEN